MLSHLSFFHCLLILDAPRSEFSEPYSVSCDVTVTRTLPVIMIGVVVVVVGDNDVIVDVIIAFIIINIIIAW